MALWQNVLHGPLEKCVTWPFGPLKNVSHGPVQNDSDGPVQNESPGPVRHIISGWLHADRENDAASDWATEEMQIFFELLRRAGSGGRGDY